jgi:hypothetical protein
MSNPLVTYLADHLAGSVHAIELVKNMRDEHRDDSLGEFDQVILTEIERDREVLDELAKQIGGGPSVIKEATAWAGEKLSRFKLGQKDSDGWELSRRWSTSGSAFLGNARFGALSPPRPLQKRACGE